VSCTSQVFFGGSQAHLRSDKGTGLATRHFSLVRGFLLEALTVISAPLSTNGESEMKKRVAWTTAHVRELKSLAKKKTPARKIAKSLKRSEGATRQKAFSMGLSLDSRA
jgi:hypothetical protein